MVLFQLWDVSQWTEHRRSSVAKTTANPDLWDTKGRRMIGKSMQALEVNRKLDKMRVSISKHYQEIMDRDNFVTADKVKNAFLGLEYRCHTLMKVYSQSRDEMEKQYKAGMKSLSTYTKYRIGCVPTWASSCRRITM